MNEIVKRLIFGTVYVTIMWFGTSYSEQTYTILFFLLGSLSFYEMWKLRIGKSKVAAYTFVITPFILIQLLKTNFEFSENEFNPSLILLMLVLTWTFDTFAFLVGTKIGKTKILPSISPKKSWEGFIGGFIFCILAGVLSQYFFRSHFENFSHALIISMCIILPFTATIGDFIESFYKRQANVKDSGTILPGHGGILDRMDAFMVTIPVIYILSNLL